MEEADGGLPYFKRPFCPTESSERDIVAKRDDSYADFVLDQLHALPGITRRRMFGGHGLYRDGRFFAIVFQGRLYFKTNERTRGRYERAGMEIFRPSAQQALRNYYEVPADVVEDAAALCEWAVEASALGE